MFGVNFKDLTFQYIPHFLRFDNLLKYIFSAIKPLSELNNNGVVIDSFGQKNPSLFQFERFIRNFLRFDARTLYLQKFLNDFWDPVQERIRIINDNTSHVLYLFNDAEQREGVFFYNNWDSTVAYVKNGGTGLPTIPIPLTGEFAVFGNIVYQAKTDNTNKQPNLNPADWEVFKAITFLFNLEDEFPIDYRIEIPLDVTLQPDYSDARFKAQVQLFNAAGRNYDGVELGNITNVFFEKR